MNQRKLLIIVAVLLGIAFVSGGIYAAIMLSTPTKNLDNTEKNQNSNSTTTNPTPKPSVNSNNSTTVRVESIYNDNIPSKKSERIQINVVVLVNKALQLMQGKNWSGDKDSALPITGKDFDTDEMAAIVENESVKDNLLTIPADLEDLFISDYNAQEIQTIILSANAEYVSFLKEKGAEDKYINELARVMPATPQRMIYHAVNDPSAPPTATEGLRLESGEKDFSILEMNLYAVDIYNYFTNIVDSEILGRMPTNVSAKNDYLILARNIATRQLTYHEMTHALQQAYVNVYTSPENLGRKSAWSDAEKRLMDVDTQYFWKWGTSEIFRESNNRQVANESQAEGVSYAVLTEVYNMSRIQKEQFWDFAFGRLDRMQSLLSEIQNEFESNYPEFNPDEFGDLLTSALNNYPIAEHRIVLKDIAGRTVAFPPYAGYLNPMLPQDVNKIWEALRN